MKTIAICTAGIAQCSLQKSWPGTDVASVSKRGLE